MSFVCEWIDATGARKQREHGTEQRAEDHAKNLVHQGVKQVVVYEFAGGAA
jgi:hypothetical protein